jgi:hypothetical protein
MSRFEREWAVVPGAARWVAALMSVGFMLLLWGVVFIPAFWQRRLVGAEGFVLPLLSLLGAAAMASYVLPVGYIWGDARRRGMNHVLWTLLAIFIPHAVGIILYFILRDPLAYPCPACRSLASKGHAYCASCGSALRASCPRCQQSVEGAWRNCAHCGAALTTGAPSMEGA